MPKKLSDSEILSLLNADLKAGVKYADTKLADERRRVEDYYNGKLPAPFHAGNSRYVSTDVYDSVESAKATLLETFSAHSDIVQFSPRGEEDVETAKIATAYCKHVLFEQNGGTELFATIIHGGLTHRNAVAKVYWDDCDDQIEEEFEDYDEDQLDALLTNEGVEIVELEQDDDELGLWSGRIVRKQDKSQVRIIALPMEEFIVPPNITSLRDSPIISHRTEKSKSDLIQEGFDKALVNKLSKGDDDELESDFERLNRFDPIGGSENGGKEGFSSRPENRKHVIYETYVRANIDGTGTKLWKFIHSKEVILDSEQVSRHPFFHYAPLPTPHRFWGENFAARVIPTQNAKTILTRSILDHTIITNNPRYGVVKGALTNPRELLDNRLGGLVNMTRPDGVFPLPQAPLNPFVFQTIAMLDDDKEDVTGVSRLSQGLNKDAISKQNSQGMVEQLIGVSMQRQKTMARAFATQFLGPLFLEIYRLVVENEKSPKIISIAGQFTEVDPRDWTPDRDVVIDFRLGYGERDQRAAEYLEFGQILAQDPAIQNLYTPEERYNLYKTVMETKGHKDVAMFLKDPKTVEPPQPDPLVQLEIEERKFNMQLAERKQSLAEEKFKAEFSLDQLRADFEARFKTMEQMLAVNESERKDRETENRIEVSNTEMELAKQATNEAPDENVKASAIVSPNG